MIGEIGGPEEARAAAFVKEHMRKPVVGFIAGRTAPPGKRMGHAGAVISGGSDTAEAKIAAMREAGIVVCEGPHLLGQTMRDLLTPGKMRPRNGRSRPARPAAATSRNPASHAAARLPQASTAAARVRAGGKRAGAPGRAPRSSRA
jgi:succinyl-CoA synthetase alpha subunit